MSVAAVIPAGVALSNGDHAVSRTRDDERSAASGLVLGVGVVSIFLELCFIVVRFANIGVINYKIRWFLIAVSACVIVCGVLERCFVG